MGSDCAGNLTGAQTPGTNIHMARRTVDNSLDTFHIGLPGTIGTSVGVGNLNTKGHALIAKLALSHPLHLLAVIIFMCTQTGTSDILTDKNKKCKRILKKVLKISKISVSVKRRGNCCENVGIHSIISKIIIARIMRLSAASIKGREAACHDGKGNQNQPVCGDV